MITPMKYGHRSYLSTSALQPMRMLSELEFIELKNGRMKLKFE